MTPRWMTETRYWKMTVVPINGYCWAIYRQRKDGGRVVRKIVWGRLMARYEKRPGEKIARASITTRA